MAIVLPQGKHYLTDINFILSVVLTVSNLFLT